MKKIFFLELLLALTIPSIALAQESKLNCPKHGLQTYDNWTIQHKCGGQLVCLKCKEQREKEELERKKQQAEIERKRRLVSGYTNELGIVSGMTINARCINTNILATRILPAVNVVYGKTQHGYVQLSSYKGNDIQSLTLEDLKEILIKGGSFTITLKHKIVPYQKKVGERLMYVKTRKDRLTRIGGGGGYNPVVSVGGHYETIDTREDKVTITLKQGVMVSFDPNFK